MKTLITCLLLAIGNVLSAQSVGIFDHHEDIGHPKVMGSAVFDKTKDSYTLSGGGYNIWFARDEFHFLYKQVTGDFTVEGNFELLGAGTDPHRKTGWMIRESLADSAVHISATVHGDGLTVLQWRMKSGMAMRDPQDELFAKDKHYSLLQLQRKGNTITMRAAKQKGQPWELIGSYTAENLPATVYVGLFICAHNEQSLEKATISEVKFIN